MSSSRLAISLRAAPSSSCECRRCAGGEEDAVAGLRADGRDQPVALGVGDVLGDRAAERAVLGDRHVGQALGAARLRPVLPGVEGPPGLRAAAGHDDRADVRRLEDAERGVGEVRGQLGELDAEAQVGLVRPEAVHRLAVGHPRDLGHLVGGQLAPQRPDDVLGDREHVVAVDEAHLEVELGELRLPVGAEVLVPEAAGDLVVPLEPADHQQLLEQLRRLRQGVPLARLQPDRDDEVARALRRGAGEVRRLHLGETVPVHDLAGDPADLRAHAHGLRRPLPAQVEVAVLVADVVRRRLVGLDRERQRRRRREHLEGGGGDLDLAGGQLRVLVALRTAADLTGHEHAVLVAQVVGLLLADDDLDVSRGVAEVEEDDAAVVAAAGHPAGEGDGGTGVGRARACRRRGCGARRCLSEGGRVHQRSCTWARMRSSYTRSRSASWESVSGCEGRRGHVATDLRDVAGAGDDGGDAGLVDDPAQGEGGRRDVVAGDLGDLPGRGERRRRTARPRTSRRRRRPRRAG